MPRAKLMEIRPVQPTAYFASTITSPTQAAGCGIALCSYMTHAPAYLSQFLGNCPANSTDFGSPGFDGFGTSFNCLIGP